MATKNAPRLDGGLIARKGEAVPTVPLSRESQPISVVQEASKPVAKGISGTIAVTVRLDPERYEQLKIHGVRNRRTNQDILVEALDAYLASKEA